MATEKNKAGTVCLLRHFGSLILGISHTENTLRTGIRTAEPNKSTC
jgi:hypothetical protein